MEVGQYSKIDHPDSSDLESPLPIVFKNVTFEVRHGKDPILYAFNLTDHTLNFGATANNYRIGGALLIFCCAGLMIQPVFWFKNNCASLMKKPKTSRYYINGEEVMDAHGYDDIELSDPNQPIEDSIIGPGDVSMNIK